MLISRYGDNTVRLLIEACHAHDPATVGDVAELVTRDDLFFFKHDWEVDAHRVDFRACPHGGEQVNLETRVVGCGECC